SSCFVHFFDLLGEINDTVKLTCKHSINNYDTILWYHHSQGDSSLKLVGSTIYTSVQMVENPFQGSFKVSGNGEQEAFLHFLKLRHPEDSGHYFCAAYSRTMIEKPQIPLQKPSCHPVHLESNGRKTALFYLALLSCGLLLLFTRAVLQPRHPNKSTLLYLCHVGFATAKPLKWTSGRS
uniref:Immunoglobulin V-set domain-containing protein n=1 Tax=Sander lucioperca TaxID=283035 RepID=A0A8D0DFI7_SANLU